MGSLALLHSSSFEARIFLEEFFLPGDPQGGVGRRTLSRVLHRPGGGPAPCWTRGREAGREGGSPRGALLPSELASSPPSLSRLQGPASAPAFGGCPAFLPGSSRATPELELVFLPEKSVQVAKVRVRRIWVPVSVPALGLLPANGEKPAFH